jgi:hypothetical protein
VSPAAARPGRFAAPHEATGTGWPDAEPFEQRQPVRGQLRRGGEWSAWAAFFAVACWAMWVISTNGDLVTAALVLVVALVVAIGLFALTRLVGRVVLERQLGRARRTARGAHLVAAAFLVGVGVAHLHEIDWVMRAWHYLMNSF